MHTRARGERDLRRIRLVGQLDVRLGRRVELDRVRALQHLLPDHGRVAADVDVDVVEVCRRRGGARLPVRVADQRQRLAGLVADVLERAGLRVALDHVRPARDDVLAAVGRRRLLVHRPGEALRHRSRDRHAERLDQERGARLRHVEHDRELVRRLDARDRAALVARRRCSDQRRRRCASQVASEVRVGDVGVRGSLERVGDVG